MEQEEVNPSVRVEVKTLEMAIEILRGEREREEGEGNGYGRRI